MSHSKFARGRASLFATSSLVASAVSAGLLGLGAAALTPTAALAANECGVGAVVTCTSAGNVYPNGISYVPATSQTVNLSTGVVVNSTGSLNPGLLIVQGGGTQSITVNGGSGVSITTGDPGAFGVLLATNGGTINASLDSISTSGANAEGVLATSGSGAVTLSVNKVATTGSGALGIDVTTGSSPIAITAGSVSTTGSGAGGISAVGSGAISVTSGLVSTGGAKSAGIYAQSAVGSVSVTGTANNTISTSGAYSRGVDARAQGAGSTVTVNVGAVSTTGLPGNVFGPDSTAIFARTHDGAISITDASVSTAGAYAAGVNALSYSGGVTVTSGTNTTTGAGADGVSAMSNYGGNVVITSTTTSTQGLRANGLYAIARQGTVNVSGGDVTTAGSQATGVYALSGKGTTVAFGNVATAGGFADGINAKATSGNVSVTGANVATKGVDALGVYGYSTTGNATINVGTVSTTGGNGVGIDAQAPLGTASVTVGSVTTASTIGGAGVIANGVGANVISSGTISTTGNNQYGDNGAGVLVTATTGSANVNVNNVSTTGSKSNAIDVRTTGGPIDIAFSGVVSATGATALGVYANATGSGAVTITSGPAGAVSTAGDYSRAILAYTNTGPITIDVNSALTSGKASPAIAAFTYNGAISVTAGSVSTLGSNSDGIDASSNGPVTVQAGSITTAGANSSGILAVSNADAVNVAVTNIVTSGSGATGILAQGAKSVTVSAGSVATSGTNATGIYAGSISGDTTVNVTGAGVTSAQGDGVYARGGTITINTSPGSTVSGKLDGILLNATTASVLNLAGTTSSSAGFAIDAMGAPATVFNSGTINGAVSLPVGADTVNNSGTFNAKGDSVFGPGDVFNNSGTFNVLPGTATAGNVTLTGLTTFNNTGLVNLSNGHVGDTLTIPGNFNGGAGSVLAIDANLAGVATQTSCAAPTAADCLVLPGGTATGVTGIRVTNLGAGPAGLNTTGIVVVDAPGGSIAPGAFVISPSSANFETRGGAGAISNGFFFDRLVPIGTTQEALVSAPDNTAFEFVELGAAATDIWYTTTGSWLDRQGDMRNTVGNLSDGNHPGVWLKAVGDWTRRNLRQSTTSLGTTFTFDTSYNQDTAALIGGVDLLHGGGEHQAWVLGLQGGYVDSDVRFNASPTHARIDGAVLGAYASYIRGPWYVDAIFNANQLNLTDTIPTISTAGLVGAQGPFTTGGRVYSYGGQVESGWRFPIGLGVFEPIGSLAYVQTNFRDLAIPGGDVAFRDSTSFRGSLGLRLSSLLHMATYTIKPSIFARAWDEFKGDEGTALFNPGDTVFAQDRFRGVFGDVGAQLAVFDAGAFTAFVNGDYKFKSGYRDYTATVGMSYHFR